MCGTATNERGHTCGFPYSCIPVLLIQMYPSSSSASASLSSAFSPYFLFLSFFFSPTYTSLDDLRCCWTVAMAVCGTVHTHTHTITTITATTNFTTYGHTRRRTLDRGALLTTTAHQDSPAQPSTEERTSDLNHPERPRRRHHRGPAMAPSFLAIAVVATPSVQTCRLQPLLQ